MTDPSGAGGDALTCEQFENAAAEYALGVLPGYERAEASAHPERCPGCRWRAARLTGTRDQLLELVPEAEPRAGFERLVMNRIDGGRRRRPLVAAALVAAALVAAALVGGGWVWGRTSAPASAAAEVALSVAPLTADGREVGQAFAYPGEPSFVYISLNTRMTAQTGPVSCSLERPDGTWVPLGMFEVRRGYGHWGASARLEGEALRTATLVLVDSAGRAVATARFG